MIHNPFVSKFWAILMATLASSGCATDLAHESIELESIDGKSMEDVIALEGQPVARTESQLTYEYNRRKEITPVWAYILLHGLAGGGGGPGPDLSYTNREHFCLTLDFEDDVVIGHELTARKKGETCAHPGKAGS